MKLNEIILKSVVDQFALSFSFEGDKTQMKPSNFEFIDSQLPEYVVVDQTASQLVTSQTPSSVDPSNSTSSNPRLPQQVIRLQLRSVPNQTIAHLTQAVPALSQVNPIQVRILQKQSLPITKAIDMIQVKPPGDKL
jgi:hypothetical protein